MTDPEFALGLEQTSADPLPVFENVTPELFDTEIRAQRKPVILKGLVEDWVVTQAAKTSAQSVAGLLQQHASPHPVPVNLKEPGTGGRYFYTDSVKTCNFARRQVPLAAIVTELLRQANVAEPMGVYMDATPADTVLPGFSRQHEMPLAPSGTEPRIWLGNSARVAPHFDLSENIACVVSGQRRFLVFPPEQVANLYMGPIENTPGGVPVSMVDPRDPDLTKFPNYAKALEHAMLAKLQPGDAIYIPRLWWHYVEASGPLNLLVNYWWDSPAISPLFSLIMATRSIRRLPPADRNALRAFFEHFVFSEQAPGTFDHIPEDARGVMGVETPQNDAAIQSTLKQMLSDLFEN
ncbi:MAG: cupin-like domain-containing protein [Pseudomonadota bacterium]